MNKKIDINDVKIEWLNKRALVLISIFAHAANKASGAVINLRDEDILAQVSQHAKDSNNEELKSLYNRIKREIKLSIQNATLSDSTAKEVDNLAVSAMDKAGFASSKLLV